LPPDQEAITLLRGLADEHRDRHERDLVRPLRYCVLVLSDVGRYAEALAAHEEAVTLAKKFADDDAARQLELADALTNLGAVLRTISRNNENASRSEKALATHEQAVTLLRKLVVEQPTCLILHGR
jgi:tetratricopeptide (TPR) repeat protein